MTNPDPEPSDTLPGAGPTPRFDLPLTPLLLSLPLLVFSLALVPPGGGFATEATEATLGPAVLNTFAMATVIDDNMYNGNGNRRRRGTSPSLTGEP